MHSEKSGELLYNFMKLIDVNSFIRGRSCVTDTCGSLGGDDVVESWFNVGKLRH